MNDGKQMKDVWTGSLTRHTEKDGGKASYAETRISVGKNNTCIDRGRTSYLGSFLWSGTNRVEAVRYGRKFIGIDVSEEYMEYTKKRTGEGTK